LISNFIDYINKLDGALIQWIQRTFSLSFWDTFFFYITDLHKELYFQLLVILPLIIYWLVKEKKNGFYKFLGLLMNLIIIDAFCGSVIKKIVGRPRPFVTFVEIVQKSPASGYSFVSNHAANVVGIAVYMSYFYPKWKGLWWGIALLVCYSRLYNGVHYFTDVLFGGLVAGVISFFTVRAINHRWEWGKK